MPITEKPLHHLEQFGTPLLDVINSHIFRETTYYKGELERPQVGRSVESIMSAYKSSIQRMFNSWIDDVSEKIKDLGRVDCLKVLRYLSKELKTSAECSGDFPFIIEGDFQIISTAVINTYENFSLLLHTCAQDLYHHKTKLPVQIINGSGKKILWLGNKNQLNNLADVLCEKKWIKKTIDGQQVDEIFMSIFSYHSVIATKEENITGRLTFASTAKVLGRILQELIDRGWINRNNSSHTNKKMSLAVCSIFDKLGNVTITKGMSMPFETPNDNPIAEVKFRIECKNNNTPFSKIPTYDATKKYTQLERKKK